MKTVHLSLIFILWHWFTNTYRKFFVDTHRNWQHKLWWIQHEQIHLWIFAKSARWNKTKIHTTLSYSDTFSNYVRNFLDDIDHETVDKYNLFTNKNVKYLFYRLNDFLLFRDQPILMVRHLKKTVNEIVKEEVQSIDW